jgi:hypothetical protein
MHESSKLEEAKYFYSRMLEEINNKRAFMHNLSAFLSSARSILQYALKEAETKAGGKFWYDQNIASKRILSFFKDKRDINIHSEPIKTQTHTMIELSSTINISTHVSLQITDKEGNIISEYNQPNDIKPRQENPTSKISNRYTFFDWTGNEDIITLCKNYLDELEKFISDGQAAGYITI